MRYKLLMVVLLLTSGIAAACTPRSAPVSSPPAATPPPVAPPAVPAVSVEETAWDKVLKAARREGRLTIYATQFTQQMDVPVDKAFNQKYGIAVDILGGRGADWVERLKTEKRIGQMVGDIVQGSSSHMESMKVASVLAANPDLPVLQAKDVWNVEPWGLDKERKYLVYRLAILAPHINTKLVTPDEAAALKSWRDFLDPKWKGRLGMLDPEVNSGAVHFLILEKRGRLNRDFLRELAKQQLKFTLSSGSDAQTLARGEVAVSLIGPSSNMSDMVVQGAPIRLLTMKEGIWGTGSAIAQVDNSPHPNAARLFLNWLFSEEGMTVIAKGFRTMPVRSGVEDFTPASLKADPRDIIMVTEEDNIMMSEAFRAKELVAILKQK